MPRTHTSPVFRTTYTYSAGNAGMWDLSSSIACARGDGAFSFSINRAAVAEVEEILIGKHARNVRWRQHYPQLCACRPDLDTTALTS